MGHNRAAFFAQQSITREDLREPCLQGGVAPLITGCNKAAIWFLGAADLAKIQPLALSHQINQFVEGLPLGISRKGGMGQKLQLRHQDQGLINRQGPVAPFAGIKLYPPAIAEFLPATNQRPVARTHWHKPRNCFGYQKSHQIN